MQVTGSYTLLPLHMCFMHDNNCMMNDVAKTVIQISECNKWFLLCLIFSWNCFLLSWLKIWRHVPVINHSGSFAFIYHLQSTMNGKHKYLTKDIFWIAQIEVICVQLRMRRWKILFLPHIKSQPVPPTIKWSNLEITSMFAVVTAVRSCGTSCQRWFAEVLQCVQCVRVVSQWLSKIANHNCDGLLWKWC